MRRPAAPAPVSLPQPSARRRWRALAADRRPRLRADQAGGRDAAAVQAGVACACRRRGQRRARTRRQRSSGAPAYGTRAVRRRRRVRQPIPSTASVRAEAATRPRSRTTAPSPRTPRRRRCSAGGAERRQERQIAVSLHLGSHWGSHCVGFESLQRAFTKRSGMRNPAAAAVTSFRRFQADVARRHPAMRAGRRGRAQ